MRYPQAAATCASAVMCMGCLDAVYVFGRRPGFWRTNRDKGDQV